MLIHPLPVGDGELAVGVRWMVRRDLPEILQIEQSVFEHGWTEEDFLRTLAQRHCVGKVAELAHQGGVLGFMIYELHKRRIQVVNLAVHPLWQRLTIGTKMLDDVQSKLSLKRRPHVDMVVPERNLAAQLFLRACGWRAVRIKRRVFEHNDDSGYVMRFSLTDNPKEEDECE